VTATGRINRRAQRARMMDAVREAFHIAKSERCRCARHPYDLQKVEYMANQPTRLGDVRPKVGRMQPDPEVLARGRRALAAAMRPIVLGGRGVLWSGARDA